MQQQQNELSRKPVVFLRAHVMNGVKYTIGTRLMMRTEKVNELKSKKIVTEYIGPWPPKEKERINLKSIDNGKDDR